MDASSQNLLIEQLKGVGSSLLDPPSSVPELINLLDDVELLLKKVGQAPSQPVQEALLIPMKALIEDQFFRHPDPNVRVTVASCLHEVMRISAPVQPYEDDQMKEIFELIVSSFENLSCQPGRCYSKSVLILQSVAKLRSCVMMLDLDCDLLIIKMFELFQRNSSPKHPHSVLIAMEKIMSVIVQESDSVSLELLKVLLSSIKKENQSASPASWELGAKIIQECAVKLKPYIMETLSSMGCCLEDYAPILSLICKSEPDMLNTVTNDSSNCQLVHSEPSSGVSHSAECVQALMAVDCHYNAPASRARKAFATESGGTASKRKKTDSNNLEIRHENGKRKASVAPESEDEEFIAKKTEVTDVQCEKAHSMISVDGFSGKGDKLMNNDISARSKGKVRKKDVSRSLGSSESKLLKSQRDPSVGSGNKSKSAKSRKDKIQSNDASKNQRKRASSDDDVIETPYGRKNYKHDLVGSRIKVWWPLDRRYYEGTITSFDNSTSKHKVDYDDGDEEVLNLRKESWEFLGDEIPTDMGLMDEERTLKPQSDMFKQKVLTEDHKEV